MTAADRPSVPRVGDILTTAEQLDALPDKAVVLDEHEEPWQKLGEGLWCGNAGGPMSGSALLRTRTDEVTVLYVPGEQPGPSTDQALAEAWAEEHRTGWEHCQDGNYGNDYWDDPTPNPYSAAARAETTTATTEEWAHRLENGGAMIWPTREQAEADREDYLSRPRDPFEPRPPASAGIWRREVTAWTEVDRG